MGKKLESEANNEYIKTCRANFQTIRKQLGLGLESFYKQYIEPLGEAYKLSDGKQYVEALETNRKNIPFEILLMYSELAGISINELMTTDLQNQKPELNPRNLLNSLFVVLETQSVKVHKTTTYDIDVYSITTSLSDDLPQIEKDFTSCLINVFLKEYVEHKDLGQAEYLDWKQSLLKDAFKYEMIGCPNMRGIQTIRSNSPIRKLYSDALKLDTKNFDAIQQKQGREQWLKEHNYLGHSEQEWRELSEEERGEARALFYSGEMIHEIFTESLSKQGKNQE